MRLLVTGGAGFIGSHFVRYLVEERPQWEVVVLERLNYAGEYDRLAAYRDRVQVHFHDLRGEIGHYLGQQIGELDYVLHLAAETHVDKSFAHPAPFVQTNVLGTMNLLEYARESQPRLKAFFFVSTDEVYGAAPAGVDHDESSPHRPSNPYSASKAAAEDLCHAWERSMGVPVIVTNSMNNIGEMQHPEKFVPKIIRAIRDGDVVTVHGSPDQPGSRKYLYARDHADAVVHLMEHGRRGEKYNLTGEEVNNLELVKRIETLMGAEAKVRFVDFHGARPGHDLRYSLETVKMREVGWTPPTSFAVALEKTVAWTLENPSWL